MGRARKRDIASRWLTAAMPAENCGDSKRLSTNRENTSRDRQPQLQCRYCGHHTARPGCLCGGFQEDLERTKASAVVRGASDGIEEKTKAKELEVHVGLSLTADSTSHNVHTVNAKALEDLEEELTFEWDIVSEVSEEWSDDCSDALSEICFEEWEDIGVGKTDDVR
ncbi:hypothetical protein L218DRAFT_1036828 [Marasmius fiardii PR-910]|nr:hypothetical protein L218DRAFT_1036828 [Marasmius fiardii PR-910]